MTKTINKTQSFEQSLTELENLVLKLETGDLTLEKSLECFERGVELTKDCNNALQKAQIKVKTLSEKIEQANQDLPEDD